MQQIIECQVKKSHYCKCVYLPSNMVQYIYDVMKLLLGSRLLNLLISAWTLMTLLNLTSFLQQSPKETARVNKDSSSRSSSFMTSCPEAEREETFVSGPEAECRRGTFSQLLLFYGPGD